MRAKVVSFFATVGVVAYAIAFSANPEVGAAWKGFGGAFGTLVSVHWNLFF
ncbi:MAG TPA: hypothetical protein VFO38_03915 [Candidatus Saccharimonadales bacterium]|nr:hypothetical protein [Candidatus Saccharimonadales bacterium]